MTPIGAAKTTAPVILLAGVPTTAYFYGDYITLYEVEREVINKKVKLKNKEGDSNSITVETQKNGNSEVLTTGYDWSCSIVIEPKQDGASTSSFTDLWNKLKAQLPVDSETNKIENKILLVRACSKNREGTPSSSVVKGKIIVKEVDSTNKSFSFENNPELNVLLGN